MVVSTGRSGYLVLKCKGSTSSLPASKGQLWVSMEAEPPVHPGSACRLCMLFFVRLCVFRVFKHVFLLVFFRLAVCPAT